MDDGALGLSLGLTYLPGIFADERELVSLAEETKLHDGILAVHMRSEGKKLIESIQETLSIAEKYASMDAASLSVKWNVGTRNVSHGRSLILPGSTRKGCGHNGCVLKPSVFRFGGAKAS